MRCHSVARRDRWCWLVSEQGVLLGNEVDAEGPGIKPIRPGYVAAFLDELADDDAMFVADTGTACIRAARHIHSGSSAPAVRLVHVDIHGRARRPTPSVRNSLSGPPSGCSDASRPATTHRSSPIRTLQVDGGRYCC